jgi:hypothetical protein
MDPLEYVLNRMENAARQDNPAMAGYGQARRDLIDGIVGLRSDLVKEGQMREQMAGSLAVVTERAIQAENELDRIKENMRRACNSLCSCGGGGPEDDHTCDVCKVWHRTMAKN